MSKIIFTRPSTDEQQQEEGFPAVQETLGQRLHRLATEAREAKIKEECDSIDLDKIMQRITELAVEKASDGRFSTEFRFDQIGLPANALQNSLFADRFYRRMKQDGLFFTDFLNATGRIQWSY